MDESESKENKPQRPRRFSQQQYDMLKRCSEKKDMSEWNEWRKKHPTEDILLEGANLQQADLKGASLNTGGNYPFRGVVCIKGAHLTGAHLEGAHFNRASLEGAILLDAHLEHAIFFHANLKGANARTAIVDGDTSIWKPSVNRYSKNGKYTNFGGVSLDTVRIDPGTKQLLEYNIRRMNWEEWYPKQNCFLRCMVRAFWWVSDYGISSPRIIKVFLASAIFFTGIYYLWGMIAPPAILDNLFVDRNGVVVPWWVVPFRAFYFSIITMTLGFSDMYANAHSIWGHILITIQALLGYVLLGALVTRFAVLFTAGGPAGKFADQKEEKR